MQITHIGAGQRLFHPDAPGAPLHVVYTGAIKGRVTTAAGRDVDVSDDYAEANDPGEAAEIAHLIGLYYESNGHPVYPDAQISHLCTPLCGSFGRELADPMQAAAAVFAQPQLTGIEDATVRHAFAQALGLPDAGAPGAQMALASAAAENASLNGLSGTGSTNVIPDVSLHTASPGTAGTSENANTGSYARQACSWNAASGGAMTNSSTLTFSTAGTVAVSYIGTWSSATYAGGTYAIGGALASAVTASSITIAAAAISVSSS